MIYTYRYLSLLLFSILLFTTKACYPVSYIVVGETKSPINHDEVVVYADFPEPFEKIAIMESASDLALKDILILSTDQQK